MLLIEAQRYRDNPLISILTTIFVASHYAQGNTQSLVTPTIQLCGSVSSTLHAQHNVVHALARSTTSNGACLI